MRYKSTFEVIYSTISKLKQYCHAHKKFLASALVIAVLLTSILFLYKVCTVIPKEANPHVTKNIDPSTFTLSSDISWSIVLATENFQRLSENDKLDLAKKYFDNTWIYAKQGGYNKQKLLKWFQDTALNSGEYGTKTISLIDGFGGFLDETKDYQYKDLAYSDFPKFNYKLACVQKIFETITQFSFSGIAHYLIIFLFSLIPSLIICGCVAIFRNNEVNLLQKISILLLILTTISIFRSYQQSKGVIDIIPASYFSVNNYTSNYPTSHHIVKAQGAWEGINHKLAYPINVSEFTCTSYNKQCREIQAYIIGKNLSVDETNWDVIRWDHKEVILLNTTKCNEVRIIIDYKNQAVTQIRTPLDLRPANCAFGNEGKFVTELVDGFDLYFKERSH